jgi:hypothetical protein
MVSNRGSPMSLGLDQIQHEGLLNCQKHQHQSSIPRFPRDDPLPAYTSLVNKFPDACVAEEFLLEENLIKNEFPRI